MDGVDLADQEGGAGGRFHPLRAGDFRGAALYYVADVDVFALQAHGFDHLGEEFAGAADEGEALDVFVVAGAFADEDEVGFRVAVAEDDFVAGFVEFAAGAFAEVGADDFEGVTLDAIGSFE